MKIIEITNPNFVVNYEFDVEFEDGQTVRYYKDDYIKLGVSKGKLIINDKFVTDAPEDLDNYIEPVSESEKITESTVDTSTLSPVKITLTKIE